MRMRAAALIVSALGVLLLAAPVGALVGGATPDTTHPYVVAIRAADGQGGFTLCSRPSLRLTEPGRIVPSNQSNHDEFLRVSGGICLGDSGGPNLLGDTILAVNAYGQLGCNGPAYSTRLDTAASLGFISPFFIS